MSNISALSYVVADVFTRERYKGNPLSVVWTQHDLTLEQYQAIAREFGYSETSFIRYSENEHILQVRSFTPAGVEVGGAGHNLLGAVYAAFLKDRNLFNDRGNEPYVFIKEEPAFLSVRFDASGEPLIGMKQRPAILTNPVPAAEIALALSLTNENIGFSSISPVVVQTEVAHLMVPVRDVASLHAALADKKQLIHLAEKYDFEGVYCFTLTEQNVEYLAEARFFNPGIGIEEDPATGSAAGTLAGFLRHHQRIQSNKVYNILQGVPKNQPSVLSVEVKEDGIWVSGEAVLVMEGTLYY